MAHSQTKLIHPKTGEIIPVDIKLADLVNALWEAGINTYCSCQNRDKTGFGYIILSDPTVRSKAQFQADNRKAITILKELSAAADKDLWFDYGPSGAVLRFQSKDLPALTDVMVNGI